MNPAWLFPLTALGAFLIGGIPFGYLLGRLRGVDIFQHGSGNIGATNVGRVLGWRFGLLVFLLDFAKGAMPVLIAQWLQQDNASLSQTGIPGDNLRGLDLLAGLTAFLGHLFPIYLRFRGGKGVATGAGVVAILVPIPTAAALFTWLAVLCATRFVALASVAAALTLGGLQLVWQGVTPLTLLCLVAAALVVVRHAGNLKRLLGGNEPHLRESPTMLRISKVLHLLAMGLWFGSCLFFTFIAALSLFHSFEALGQSPERPAWFPLPPEYAQKLDGVDGPREQGSRAAGFAVGPMFPRYFLLQGLCGFLALATALGWRRLPTGAKIHKWRTALLLVALITVLIGWPLERHIAELRIPRHQTMEVYLRQPNDVNRAAMKEARAAFGQWHTVSLFLNFATVGLVTAAMVLAAWLPEEGKTSTG